MFRGSVQEYWLHTPFACFPFTSPPVRHRVPSRFNWALTPYGCCMHGCRVERTSEAVWYWSRMHLFSQQPRIFWTWTMILFPMTPARFLFHKFIVLQTDNNTIMNTVIWNRKNAQIRVELGYNVMKGAECFVSL